MPRNYIRKTTRQNWSEISMINALDAVKGGIQYKTASKQFSVPIMSLKRRARGKNVYASGSAKVLGSRRQVFSEEQELELCAHILDMEARMYGLTTKDILSLAYQLAERNNIKHPFSSETGRAGKDWLRGFRKRHTDITMREPESTSAARARAFNKPVVDKFYGILQNCREKHSFPSHRIYNVDETSINTVSTKNAKVFAKKGRKQVARITSAERGDTTTAVICGSAAGYFIPPMLIFRRVRMKIELMDGAPPGSVYVCNSSGWMKIEVFTQWFDHFLAHTKPSAEDPALLILDGHLSHTKNLHVILKARENNVTILCLPPHCTHKLQPLDVAVMYPMSVYHNQALEKWMNNNPGRIVSVFQISKIFAEAYLKAAVPLNIINGFEKCGISPFNPDVFTAVDFVAAETTEQEDDNESLEPRPSPSEALDTIQFSVVRVENNLPSTAASELPLHAIPLPCTAVVELPFCASPPPYEEAVEPTLLATPLPQADQINSLSPSISPYNLPTAIETMRRSVSPIASTSFNVPPRQIQALPKIIGKRTKATKARGKGGILTSTPYKNLLEDERKRQIDNELKKAERMNKKAMIATVSKKTKEKVSVKGKVRGKENVTRKRKGIGKGQSNLRRGKKSRKHEMSESSSEEGDTECLFCNEKYSKDNRGEGWIRCCVCFRWGHDACAGVDPGDADEFTCDFCVDDRFGYVRKELQM